MTTLEQNPATTGPGRDHGLAYWAVSDCWNITRRTLTHYQRHPSAIVWQLGFPILSVLLYGYVFGSAMKVPGGGDYREFLMPGMFAMTMAMGFMNTAVAVVTDAGKGSSTASGPCRWPPPPSPPDAGPPTWWSPPPN